MRVFQPRTYLTLDFRKCELLLVDNVTFKDNGAPELHYERFEYPRVDLLAEELRSFVDCVRHRSRPRVDAASAREVMACAFRVREKVEEGLVGRAGLLSQFGGWVGLEAAD